MPILFSAPMVRALLNGSKTQTRRVVKPQPPAHMHIARHLGDGDWQFVNDVHMLADSASTWRCPYGQPGDRLWVREAWVPGYDHDPDAIDGAPKVSVIYRADKAEIRCLAPSYKFADEWAIKYSDDGECAPPWRPSIHMPRWASRITLEITGVRVERLQDISEADAIAEGAAQTDGLWWTHDRSDPITGNDPVESYRRLWEHINGPASWEANPWVWVTEFKRVEGGAS